MNFGGKDAFEEFEGRERQDRSDVKTLIHVVLKQLK